MFLSMVGLSRYISDCGKREDVFFLKTGLESEVLEMDDSYLLFQRNYTHTCGKRRQNSA